MEAWAIAITSRRPAGWPRHCFFLIVLPSRPMRDGRFYKFWVYIVCSPSGTLYIGLTGYINVRIEQHKNEALEGFTKKYGCKRLVYYESYDSFYKAERREKQLKGWRRAKKIALIEKVNPRWRDLAEQWGWKMLFRGQSLVETP
jgi:putative endonuclease